MIKQLTKIGNSQEIIFDKAILELLNIKDGSSFEITTKDDLARYFRKHAATKDT